MSPLSLLPVISSFAAVVFLNNRVSVSTVPPPHHLTTLHCHHLPFTAAGDKQLFYTPHPCDKPQNSPFLPDVGQTAVKPLLKGVRHLPCGWWERKNERGPTRSPVCLLSCFIWGASRLSRSDEPIREWHWLLHFGVSSKVPETRTKSQCENSCIRRQAFSSVPKILAFNTRLFREFQKLSQSVSNFYERPRTGAQTQMVSRSPPVPQTTYLS